MDYWDADISARMAATVFYFLLSIWQVNCKKICMIKIGSISNSSISI